MLQIIVTRWVAVLTRNATEIGSPRPNVGEGLGEGNAPQPHQLPKLLSRWGPRRHVANPNCRL